MHVIQVETDPSLNGLDTDVSINILNHTFQRENVINSEVTIIFGDKSLLQNLKKEFFKIDKATDVIAFRFNEYESENIEGEIYICLTVAKENAEYYDEPYKKEIARLIIHGGLHLIGYDDNTEDNRYTMRNLENKYLKELKF